MAIYRHTYTGSLGGSETFAHGWSGQRTPADIDGEHAAGSAWFSALIASTGFLPDFSDAVTWLRHVTQEIAPDGTIITSREGNMSISGTAAGGSLPYEVSCVISLRTALSGRSRRGRYYLPCFTYTTLESDTGLYSPTTVNDQLNAAASAFMAAMAAGSIPVVWSQTLGVATPVSVIQVGRVPDVQRRRRRDQVEGYASIAL